MKYARKRNYKRPGGTRRFKRARYGSTTRPRFGRRGRRYRRGNINNRTVRVKKYTIGYDLTMEGFQATGPQIFRTYLMFCINQDEAVLPVTIKMNDAVDAGNAYVISPMTTQQLNSWKELYGKTKFMKCVIKYHPANTMGYTATGQSNTSVPQPINISYSSCANMYTIPIYENTDYIVNESQGIRTKNNTRQLADIISKPYCKEHSIYKPWTRVLVPKLTCNYPTYPAISNSTIQQKRGGWIDLVRGRGAEDADGKDRKSVV